MSATTSGVKTAPSQKSRRWLRWAAYVAAGLLSLILLLACAGFVYEQVEESRDRRLNHPPGQLVDVGSYRMHLYCTGKGSPTVVLDAGLGDYWLVWNKTQPQIANFAHVCAYDRAGLGWSDRSPQPRTTKIFAEELHTLLHSAGVPGPYVLAGHSLSGYTVRIYASLYPADVVGMVLVDSSHPDSFITSPPSVKRYVSQAYREIYMQGLTMPFGIPRLMGWCGTDPPEFRSMVRAVECQMKPYREIHEEHANILEDGEQLRATPSLGNMPLVVLSHDPEKALLPSGILPKDDEKHFSQALNENAGAITASLDQ